jgi:hypothetical protein
MDFDTFMQQAGFKPGQYVPPDTVKEYQKKHAEMMQQAAQPAPQVTFTNAPNGEPLAIMGNTMQKLGPEAPKVQTMAGNDGVLYAVNPQERAALAITNAQGQPFVPAPKQPRGMTPEELIAMGAGGAQAQQGGGWLDWFTGRGRQQPAAGTQEDAAAFIAASQVPGRSGGPALPAEVAAPAAAVPVPKTKDEVKAAYRAGAIDSATAVKLLRGL